MLIFVKCLFYDVVVASSLNSISVKNNSDHSTVIIRCNAAPGYKVFLLHNPERMVIDLSEIIRIQNVNMFPMNFDGNNLIRHIRANVSVHCQSTRIVCDLNYMSDIKTIIQKKVGKIYHVILMVSKKRITQSKLSTQRSYSIIDYKTCCTLNNNKELIDNQKKIINVQYKEKVNSSGQERCPIIVAIDAGHGGHDPGATSYYGIHEKNITFSIAKKLKKKLDSDPIFRTIMIRDGDYFLSVMARSDLARRKKANILVSIHADSSLNSKVKGASVWILSNQRVKSEMSHWLQQCKEKYAELLGGLGYVLTHYNIDPYFNHLILDLQFGYTQRVGYGIATHVLNQLKNVGFLHKNIPECSGFGVLRSPDIPSILVETGFISNLQEGRLLATDKYQERIAEALYKGLKSYFIGTQKKKLFSCT
ncbi:N-acetylmuramoyl-L-alanine amidase [Candidatus Blochmanniella floridana]|uniref:N-acetylmuramoyl-L-alanine amidase n=1 Tax=Blochmanniella floridana TaxID=203907 RepID=Q7VQP5_BLOFL|nr:N-acetylmuramoyl-L-alanine amidase [Candidatus Blochmannia floridanus]